MITNKLCMSKKKAKIDNISDRLGNLTKNSELQKARDVLEKAKAINRTVRHAPSTDNEFRREKDKKKDL